MVACQMYFEIVVKKTRENYFCNYSYKKYFSSTQSFLEGLCVDYQFRLLLKKFEVFVRLVLDKSTFSCVCSYEHWICERDNMWYKRRCVHAWVDTMSIILKVLNQCSLTNVGLTNWKEF